MIFWRIINSKVYPISNKEKLGFEENEGLRIPDKYLGDQEFIIMRTCFGLGDWGIISSMPRLLKEKYPNCKIYLPSENFLSILFNDIKENWSTWNNPFKTVIDIFKNNPYIDGFIDNFEGEIYHDHYRVYNKDIPDMPLIKQMLKFWQFTEEELKSIDYIPELYFTNKEIELGDKIIKEHVGDQEFGGLLITNRFEQEVVDAANTVKDKLEITNYFLNKHKNLPFFYWVYKPKSQLSFSFNGCLDLRNISTRIQLYIRSKAKLNLGTHCGFLDCVSRYSKVYQIQRVYPLNQNNIETNTYLNKSNYKQLI
jgi:hypothetical protein